MPFEHTVDPKLLRPTECCELGRLGSAHDGGYVVPLDAIRTASTMLSFGLSDDWTFERDAVRLNPTLRVIAFDHSIGPRRYVGAALSSAVSVPLRFLSFNPRGAASSFRRFRRALDYFRFFRRHVTHRRKRIWYNTSRSSAAIADVIREAGQQPLSVFAKIDIEGTEYRILPYIADQAQLFTGLVIEFHDTDICSEQFNATMTRLRESFEVVHVHGNNHADLSVDGVLPLTLELSFLNKRLAKDPRPYEGPLPRPGLDAPNNEKASDFVLRLSRTIEGGA
ncbi:MAG: hypothetical protein ABJF01_22540 [bacterium]